MTDEVVAITVTPVQQRFLSRLISEGSDFGIESSWPEEQILRAVHDALPAEVQS